MPLSSISPFLRERREVRALRQLGCSKGTTSTGAAAVTNSGTSSAAILNFTVPQGTAGTPGAAATVAVGTTSTGAAAVTNSGTSSAAILNFTVPQGTAGGTGPPVTFRNAWLIGTVYATGDAVSYSGSSYIALAGNTGLQPDINPSDWGLLARVGNTGAAGSTGGQGSSGAAATVAVGTTSTGAAAVTNSGTSSAAILNFTVPQGIPGNTGPAGPTPSGAANLSLMTPDGTSGAAALRALRAADILAAGLLSNNTTGNASTSTIAAHAGTADLASVAVLATSIVCASCTTGAPVCWNGVSLYTAGCVGGGGGPALFDSFSGLFDSVSDLLFDSSTN